MGGNMSCLKQSKPKSADHGGSSPSATFTKSKRRPAAKGSSEPDYNQTRRRYKEKHHHHHHKTTLLQNQKDSSLQLQHSPDHGFKSPRRKIHPSSSSASRQQVVPSRSRRLIEAKDSMCLDRPMMMMMNNININCKQEEEKEEECCLSSVISGRGGEGKRVRFKLPPVLVLYSPSEEETSQGYYSNSTTSEDSFFLMTLGENWRGGSVESPDEICYRLAVNTLPQASFSSSLVWKN